MVEDKIIYFSKEEYKNHIRDSLLRKCSFSKSGLMEYLFIKMYLGEKVSIPNLISNKWSMEIINALLSSNVAWVDNSNYLFLSSEAYNYMKEKYRFRNEIVGYDISYEKICNEINKKIGEIHTFISENKMNEVSYYSAEYLFNN